MLVLIPMFFLCFVTAAEIIDNEPKNKVTTSSRMIKHAEKRANPPSPKIPDFLNQSKHGGKRYRDVHGDTKTAFLPEWGLCEQDEVLGSSMLAQEWSKCSITAPDKLKIAATTGIGECEGYGALALYQASVFIKLLP